MLSRKPIVLYYFSGTGNTLLIARKTKEAFEKQNYNVVLRKITEYTQGDLEQDCHLGIVVPVAIQSTFPIVWDFINGLPIGDQRKVFLADTMESFSGGIVGPIKKSLEAKGYQCIGASEFKMATSMQTSEKKVQIGKEKNKKSLRRVEEYVQSLIEERSKWRRMPGLSDIMRMISKDRLIWTKTSKRITVNDSRCIQCRVCEKYCPVGAIHLINHEIEMQYNHCISCMRCVNYCPKNAFKLGGKHVAQKQVVKVNEL